MFAHFRPIFIGFLSLLLGIFLAELLREGKSFYIIFAVAVLLAFLFMCVLAFVFKNKVFKFFRKYLKFFCVTLVCLSIGAFSYSLVINRVNQENNPKINESTTYFVIGTIDSTPVLYDDNVTFFLTNATLTSSEEHYKLNNRGIYVKVDTNSGVHNYETLFNAKIGDTVLFDANLKNTTVLDEDGVFSFAYKNGVRYFAYVTKATTTVVDGTMGTLDKVRTYIKDIIYSSMDERNAGLAYAVFVGDKTGLDYDIQQNFRVTGLSHMLAVSGLHVSIMMMVLMWVFGRFRLNSKVSLIIIAVILGLYCTLCGFSASVVRASLMTIFLLFGKAFGKQVDQLNSLSLAGIILLLVDPMFVFDLSFLLSFASMFGIVLLYQPIHDFFIKLKLGNFVSSSLAISISAQIATLPFLINTFGYFSIVSLVSNFLIGPIFEYTYIIFFVGLVLSLIMPFLNFLLWAVQWGFWLVDVLSGWIASWSITTLNASKLSTLALFWFFITMFCVSFFNVSKKKTKLFTIGALAVCGTVLIALNSVLVT